MNAHSSELHRQNEAWKAARQRLNGAAIDRASLLASLQESRDGEAQAKRDVVRLIAEVRNLTREVKSLKAANECLSAENEKLKKRRQPRTNSTPHPDWDAAKKIAQGVLAKYPGITWENIISRHRKLAYILPRHECMAEIYWQLEGSSYPVVAEIFNRKDHTGIMYAVRKIEALRQSDPTRYVSKKPKRAQEEMFG